MMFLVFNAICIAAENGDVIVDSASSNFLGRSYETTVSRAQLKSARKWNAKTEILPLSPEKASATAEHELALQLGWDPLWPDPPGWWALRVELINYREPDTWYYKIGCRALVPGSSGGQDRTVEVFVMLDGKVSRLSERMAAQSKPKTKGAAIQK